MRRKNLVFFSVNSIYELLFLIFKGKKRKIGGGILKTSMKKDRVESNFDFLNKFQEKNNIIITIVLEIDNNEILGDTVEKATQNDGSNIFVEKI